MTKTIARTVAASLLLLIATACSSTPGTPSPESSAGIPASPSSTGPQVPQVTSPLDVAKYEQDPCSALTQTQAKQIIGAVRSSKDDGNVAPMCTWFDSDNSGFSLGFLPGQGGIATIYKNSVDAGGGYFQVSPQISGQPAAFSDVTDNRESGGCQIFIGAKNDESFSVSALLRKSSPSYGDPCALVTKIAEAAVTTIKAGA